MTRNVNHGGDDHDGEDHDDEHIVLCADFMHSCPGFLPVLDSDRPENAPDEPFSHHIHHRLACHHDHLHQHKHCHHHQRNARHDNHNHHSNERRHIVNIESG